MLVGQRQNFRYCYNVHPEEIKVHLQQIVTRILGDKPIDDIFPIKIIDQLKEIERVIVKYGE